MSTYNLAIKEDLVGKNKIINFKDWRMMCDRFEVFDPSNQIVPLTTGEFLLLKSFLLNPDQVLSRDYLLNVIHGINYDVFDRAIDIQIGRLRKKLKDNWAHPVFIKTVRDIGYIFVPKVIYE